MGVLERSGLPDEIASLLAPLQRESVSADSVVEDLLDTLDQQIAFAIDPDDLAGTYYQILQVAAHIVSAPEVSAGLILVRDEQQNLVRGGGKQRDWAVRAARLGAFNSEMEWRLNETSIARRVMDTGITANVPDVSKDDDYKDSGTEYDQSSELIAPLMDGADAFGVIGLDSPYLHAFTDTDRRNLERVTRIAVVAIKRAEDILAARRSREQLDAARELISMLHPLFPSATGDLRSLDIDGIRRQVYGHILELGTAKTESEHGAIVLVEKTETGVPSLAIKQEISSKHLPRTVPRWPITSGVTGQAYRSGMTVNVAEVSSARAGDDFVPYFDGARSELAVPMKRGDTIVGVLDIESNRKHHFTTAQIQWVEFLAEQAAFALAAVDLATKSKIELEFSELAHQIDRALIDMRSLPEGEIRPRRDALLSDLLRETCRITKSSIGRVLLAMNAYRVDDTLDMEHGQFIRMISTEPHEGKDAE
ncbi:MAG TPA: GAF domain-containing protein, partial [Gemmatimonadaceae bacterium]